jgi:hypothetical protein
MLHQVDDALLRAPCPVPSCPAYEPNSGFFLPKPINKSLIASRGAGIVMQSSGFGATRRALVRVTRLQRFTDYSKHLLSYKGVVGVRLSHRTVMETKKNPNSLANLKPYKISLSEKRISEAA